MHKFKHGDFVWASTRLGEVKPAVVGKEEELDIPRLIQRSRRPDRVLIYFYPDKSDVCVPGRHYVAGILLKPFKEEFERCAKVFYKQKGSMEMLKALTEMINWPLGVEIIEKMRAEGPRQKHGRTEACICGVCNKVAGTTVECEGCQSTFVHRRPTTVSGPAWINADCPDLKKEESGDLQKVEDSMKLVKLEPVLKVEETDKLEPGECCVKPEKPEDALVLVKSESQSSLPSHSLPTYFSIPQDHLQSDHVFKKIATQANSDDMLYALICEKQREHRALLTDFESRKYDLHNAKLGDQEFRMALFRLQEMHSKACNRVKTELTDQLQSAQIFGFESIKHLQKEAGNADADPRLKEQEAYRQSQKTVVEKLLVSELRQEGLVPIRRHLIPKRIEAKYEGKGKNKRKEQRTLGSVLLHPGSKNSVFNLLSRCISSIKTLKVREEISEDELSLPLLSAIVKVAHDATISNCSTTSNLDYNYMGGATDPERLTELLVKIRHKY